MSRKQAFVTVLAFAALTLSAFAVDHIFWDKTKTYGVFDDPNMWNQPAKFETSGADRLLRMESSDAGTGVTNTVRLADYNLRGAWNLYMWTTSSLILDGSDVWFRQHPTEEDEVVNNTGTYNAFTVRDNDYSQVAFSFGAEDLAHDATISFSNAVQRFDRSVSPHAMKWTIESGHVSFAEPGGANASHKVTLDCNGTDKVEGRVTVEVGPEAEVVFPEVDFQCLSTNGELVVDGGKLDVLGEFKMDTTASASGWRNYVCTNYLTVRNGGRFRQLGGGTTFGLNGNQNKRVECITVTGSGSRYEIAATAGNVTTECATDLSVLDGGVFETHKTMNMSAGYAANVNNKTRIVVSGAGSKYDGADSSLYLARKSEMFVEDGAEAILYHGLQIGYDVSGGSGEDNDSPSMTIRGDGTVVKMVSQSDGQTGVYVGNCTGTGTLNIEGGTLRGNTDANHIMMRIGAEYNSKGKGVVNMSGGALLIGDGTYDQCVVGFRGDAEFNLSGGEVVAKCPLTFNYETTRATAPVTSLFNQTGGEATFKNADLCSLTVTEHRHSELRLDGGVFNTAYVTASKSKAAGDVGTAKLTANGGTLKPTASRNTEAEPFVAKMDEFLLGPKGLTLDTGSNATLVKGAIGNKSGEQGLFVKKGSATLTLVGGDYTVSNTRIDEGEVVLGDAEPVFATALAVGAQGTFSLAGSATGVTLAGLAVANGTIVVDPTDVITVNGPVSLVGLRLSFTSLPELETAADFLVVAGELSAESVRALRRAIVSNMPGEGEHIDITPVYDPQTGKTTVSLKYATDADPIEDEVTWNGAGGDWAAGGNWDGGVPTAEKKAVFPETAVKTVAVNGAAKAGAVEFAAGGYTLTGEGALEICGEQGAAEIAVTAGAATVDVPVTLDAVTALPVSGGASLTLAKPILDGGLKKSGAGRLVLAATNDFFKEVSVEGGRNVLADAGAVNGAAQVKLGANDTLAIEGEGEQHLAMPVAVTSDIDNPAIIDTAADVTIDQIDVAGALIKRGAGTLTIDATSGKASVLSTAFSANYEARPSGYDVLSHFPADGTKPAAQQWGGFTVAEGEVVLKGTSDSPAIDACNVVIGMNATNMDVNAQARLVVDGVVLNASTKHSYLGYGVSYQTGVHKTTQRSPALVLRNGAYFKGNTLHIGNQTWGGEGCHPTFAATNSTAYFYILNFTGNAAEMRNLPYFVAKDSDIMSGQGFRIQGKFDIDLDHCYLGKGNINGVQLQDTITLGVDSYNIAQPQGVMRFRNGTLARVTFSNLQYPTNPIEFLWDDSEWCWDKAYGDFTFAAASVGAQFSMTMQGKGLVLKPAAGATFTTEVPFKGEGGFQNLGAGTVKFASGTVKFTGAAYAAAGATIDLSEAGAFTAKLAGPGTFKLGAQSGLRVAFTATDDWTVTEVPTLDATALTGILTVDFGRDAEHPLSDTNPKGLVIAKLAPGTTYVPTALAKVRNTGLKSKRGVLTVNANGEVVMDVIDTGLMMIVR